MAQRGQSFQQILAHYFPNTHVGDGGTGRGGEGVRGRWGDGETGGEGDAETLGRGDTAKHSASHLLPLTPSPHPPFSASPRLCVSASPRRLSASNFQLTYPQTVDEGDAEEVLSLLGTSRAQLLRRVSAAGIQARFPKLEIVINATTGDFVGRTGMPPWAAAATKNNRMELQPLPLLKRRRILETTLRHELVHVLVDSIGGGQTPRWLAEGMAVHFSGEGKMIERYQPNRTMPVEAIEQALASSKSAEQMRSAYAAAYKAVRELIQAESEAEVWQRVAERRYSVNRTVAPTLIS